jgi:hypothetical protein
MARRNARNQQAQALRTLADELEAGTRELSPTLVKALDQELDDEGGEELSPEEHERVWAKEIRRRLAERKAGKDRSVDFGTLLAELRARLT